MKKSKEQKAMQAHHDMYVRRRRKDALSPLDMEQYKLAIRREHEGLVAPLPLVEPTKWYIKILYWIIATIAIVFVMWLTSRFGGWLGPIQTLVFSGEGLLWILASTAILFNK